MKPKNNKSSDIEIYNYESTKPQIADISPLYLNATGIALAAPIFIHFTPAVGFIMLGASVGLFAITKLKDVLTRGAVISRALTGNGQPDMEIIHDKLKSSKLTFWKMFFGNPFRKNNSIKVSIGNTKYKLIYSNKSVHVLEMKDTYPDAPKKNIMTLGSSLKSPKVIESSEESKQDQKLKAKEKEMEQYLSKQQTIFDLSTKYFDNALSLSGKSRSTILIAANKSLQEKSVELLKERYRKIHKIENSYGSLPNLSSYEYGSIASAGRRVFMEDYSIIDAYPDQGF